MVIWWSTWESGHEFKEENKDVYSLFIKRYVHRRPEKTILRRRSISVEFRRPGLRVRSGSEEKSWIVFVRTWTENLEPCRLTGTGQRYFEGPLFSNRKGNVGLRGRTRFLHHSIPQKETTYNLVPGSGEGNRSRQWPLEFRSRNKEYGRLDYYKSSRLRKMKPPFWCSRILPISTENFLRNKKKRRVKTGKEEIHVSPILTPTPHDRSFFDKVTGKRGGRSEDSEG